MAGHGAGSEISSLVTSREAATKEIFRLRRGITQPVPGITDFRDTLCRYTASGCVDAPGTHMFAHTGGFLKSAPMRLTPNL